MNVSSIGENVIEPLNLSNDQKLVIKSFLEKSWSKKNQTQKNLTEV